MAALRKPREQLTAGVSEEGRGAELRALLRRLLGAEG